MFLRSARGDTANMTQKIFFLKNINMGIKNAEFYADFKFVDADLKVPKCEIFDPFFFTPINPIWVSDLRTGEKKNFVRRLRQIFAILFFLRRLSVR
jgi:hypothetical protein